MLRLYTWRTAACDGLFGAHELVAERGNRLRAAMVLLQDGASPPGMAESLVVTTHIAAPRMPSPVPPAGAHAETRPHVEAAAKPEPPRAPPEMGHGPPEELIVRARPTCMPWPSDAFMTEGPLTHAAPPAASASDAPMSGGGAEPAPLYSSAARATVGTPRRPSGLAVLGPDMARAVETSRPVAVDATAALREARYAAREAAAAVLETAP